MRYLWLNYVAVEFCIFISYYVAEKPAFDGLPCSGALYASLSYAG